MQNFRDFTKFTLFNGTEPQRIYSSYPLPKKQ